MATFKRDDVVIRFGGDDSAFQKTAKRVKKTGEDIAKSMGKTGQQISALFSSFRGGIAAGVAATASAMTLLAKSSLESADALAKTADKIGISIEGLQELRHAASTVGVEERALDTALQRFSRRLGEAEQGTGVLYKELQRLGINLRDSQGNIRRVEDVLGDYADAVSRAGSAQEQLRLTVAAFDTEGAGLVNLLREGADGMEAIRQAAQDLGIVLDEQLIRKSEVINQTWDDAITRLSTRLKGFALSVVDAFADVSLEAKNVAQVQALIADKTDELKKKEQDLARTQSDNLRQVTERQIKKLREEISALEEKEEQLRSLVKVQQELNVETEKGAKTSLAAAEKASQIVQDALKQAGQQAIKAAQAEAKAPTESEILRAALDDFRKGNITATQLGIIQGIQPFEQPAAGAFGTSSNLTRPPPDTSQIVPTLQGTDLTFTTRGDIQRQEAFEAIAVTPGPREFGDSLQRDLDNRVFIARVQPVLVDDSEPIEPLIDKVGGRD